MPMPYLGPLTEAIFKVKDGKPPAINREWGKKVRTPGDLVFLWAAATRHETAGFSWSDITVDISNENSIAQSLPVSTPAAHIERLVASLANEGRIRILQALYGGPLSAGQLADAVGARGGGLYHHLRELKYAAYVADKDGRYELTNLGRQMLVTVSVLASRIIVDRGEEGLGLGTHESTAQ